MSNRIEGIAFPVEALLNARWVCAGSNAALSGSDACTGGNVEDDVVNRGQKRW
jgi:hypothetical protein